MMSSISLDNLVDHFRAVCREAQVEVNPHDELFAALAMLNGCGTPGMVDVLAVLRAAIGSPIPIDYLAPTYLDCLHSAIHTMSQAIPNARRDGKLKPEAIARIAKRIKDVPPVYVGSVVLQAGSQAILHPDKDLVQTIREDDRATPLL